MSNVAVIDRKARMQISSRCHANDWFKHFKPEQEKEVKNFKVNRNKELEIVKPLFLEYSVKNENGPMFCKDAEKMLKDNKISCTQKSITEFLVAFMEFQYEYEHREALGEFLSAMMNLSESKKLLISTRHLEGQDNIHGLCSHNTKDIIIRGSTGGCFGDNMLGGNVILTGDAGSLVGNGMQGGKIIIKGDVTEQLGNLMRGGTIIVEGDAEERVGFGTEGGTIIVKGWAGFKVGEAMEGGTIHINGNYGSLGKIEGGDIYHKGKLIVKNGRKLV